jgi:hypothetical protein
MEQKYEEDEVHGGRGEERQMIKIIAITTMATEGERE